MVHSLFGLIFLSALIGTPYIALGQSLDCKQLLKTAKYKKQSFTGCQVLAERKAVALWLAVDDARGRNGVIYFRLLIRETNPKLRGWMALGLSEMGAMSGADMMIIHKNDNGSGYTITDAHATGFYTPLADTSQDLVLIDFTTKGSLMTATFARKLKTCDAEGDHEIQRGLGQFLIWANGAAFGPGFRGISYHGTKTRGYVQRQMLDLLPKKGKGGPAAAAADTERLQVDQPQPLITFWNTSDTINRLTTQLQQFYNTGPKSAAANPQPQQQATMAGAAAAAAAADLLPLPKITDNGDGTYETDILCSVPDIPAIETTYMNCYVRLPDDKKYHITSYTTLIGNKKLVHHSVIYACLRENAEPNVIDLVGKTGPGPYNQKDHRMLCEVFYMVGPSPSAPTYTLPKTTGLPFGKDSYRYFAIEVHYNNPEYLSGQSDPGTGLKLKFQDASLRPHDVGILTISQFILDIPARQETVVVNTTLCSSECTGRFKQPVTMISQFLHMHGLGKGVKTTRVRNNIEKQPLATLRAFDYGYQTWVDIPDSEQILYPNDELTMTCIFDSSSRENATHWGFGTQEEMCFWWIYYYPAQPGMGLCNSLGDSNQVLCSNDVSDLQNLKEAADAGNDTVVLQEIDRIRAAGRAITGEAQPVYARYDPMKACSAQLPKV